MKVVLIKSYLKDCLSMVVGITAENANLPILKNIFLEAVKGKIRLIATNLEIAISCFVSGKVIEDGSLSVNGGIFLNLVNNLNSERLNLAGSNNNLEIKTDNYEGLLMGMPGEDFPIIPKIKNEEEYIEIGGEILKDAFSGVLSAAESRDIRPELNTILMDYSIEQIKIAATDSFRLAEKTLSNSLFESTVKKPFRILIPRKTAQEAVRIIKGNETVKVIRDESQILFKTEEWECISRLAEGNFPEYAAILPKEYECRLVMEKTELVNAIKVASVLGGKSNEVTLKISAGKKTVEVFSSDKTVGENTSLLPAKIDGQAEKVVFNGRYLAEGLKAIQDENVFLGLSGEKPAILKGGKDESYFYLLAPVLNS
jgi:DNA polymerase III subunit beta